MALRECNSNDYPKLVEFWNSNSGWDVIDLGIWKERFLSSPNGNSFVVVVEHDGVIKAQLIFVSMIVSFGKEILLGSRPFAAVITKMANSISGYKYIVQLYNFGIQLLKKKKFDLLIMLPDPRWRRLASFFDLQVFSFPLYKLSIAIGSKFLDFGNQVRFIEFEDSRINSLWDEISNQDIFMVSRNREYLKWKNSHRDYKIIGIFEEDVLIGIATFLEKAKENQILVCDLLFKVGLEEFVIQRISSFLSNLYKSDFHFDKIVCLVTESLKDPFSKVGYEYGDYDFYFGIKVLNPKIPKRILTISNWYVSAND
jgi:hypothetical protein